MCKTKKIITGVLCVIVAGIGIAAISLQANVASAQTQTAGSAGITATTTPTPTMSIAQLQQIIDLLKQQIQQIILLLQQRAYVQPVCGDGVCETAKGETAASCSKDCGQIISCIQEGGTSYLEGFPCCAGLERQTIAEETSGGLCSMANLAGGRCTSAKCGNGVCETAKGENRCNCPKDCGNIVRSCPAPNSCELPSGMGVVQVAVWAKNPTTGECCEYGLACAAPIGWVTYFSDSECKGTATACAKEGEVFDDSNRQCCAGLVKTQLLVNCSADTSCAGYPAQYTCGKPVTTQKTCAEICKAQGYTNSKCNSYAVSPQGFANKCGIAGYVESGQSASDCQIDFNADGMPRVGAGRACCCGGNTAIKCLQEGQIGSGGPLLSTVAGQECCPGLKAWPMPNAVDAPFLCTAKCGNGVCDSLLEGTYCPQDCSGICGRQLPTAAEKTQCTNAGGKIFCGNGWCLCACDAVKPACSSSLSADQCKIAGGTYLCPENYSSTSVYLGSGSATTYYKSSCYCSCPVTPMPTTPSDTFIQTTGGSSATSTAR